MAKRKSLQVCSSCGHQESKWLGQCPACGEWNTLEERLPEPERPGHFLQDLATPQQSALLSQVAAPASARLSTGIGELDRALGGGLMEGSTVLIGGEPGIGKSTLLLQAAASVQAGPVLYVSGEESPAQIRQRADRLGISQAPLHLLCSAHMGTIQEELKRLDPRLVIVDSVQTMIVPEAGAVPGTINQIKTVTHELAEWSRLRGAQVILVAHVTKEGQIAGPKVVEHLVDAVLLFEQSGSDLRFLRATKNRFGAIEEVGIFTMEQTGLVELTDPGRIFLGTDRTSPPPGVVAAPCYEGSRVLVVEIQALTVPAKGAVSRTFSDRIDNRRVSRVAAVLEKHLGVTFSDQDIYINVAGGIRIQDVAIDLPLAVALFSARQGKELPSGVLATGELSLAGEVRPVSHRAQRIKAAEEMGFSRLIGPPGAAGSTTSQIHWMEAPRIAQAIRQAFTANP
ncbi:DNA repair protein RadA/Sms [Alkalispirochaeta americana]|uniref:DNA repair protein RadA n=1 Tax=Alkalispirochaeta americana TaxID=159291 RepID=A0A1N6RHZ9_9SPIO|nr:DNA repair protein RadA [Alkalispirochaeta americana]SIQ28473.1 DNA repair protein RadA/Sms [Alkalispirochaeta americana]